MKSRRIFAVAAVAIAVSLPVAPARADETLGTATTYVTATILPYAEVTLDETSIEIIIPGGVTYYGPVYVGGTVLCNTSTTLFTRVTKPLGAPGEWESYPVSEIKEPGQGYDPHLLRIMVLNIPTYLEGWSVTLNVSGKTVQDPGEIVVPPAGEVTLTVVPG